MYCCVGLDPCRKCVCVGASRVRTTGAMRRRTPALHLPIGTIDASPCPAPNLVTYYSGPNQNLNDQFSFPSSDFHAWPDQALPAPHGDFDFKLETFQSKANRSFSKVVIPQGTTLYHWRSAVFPRENEDQQIVVASLTRLPKMGERLYTDDILYTNTADEWLYDPTYEDFYQTGQVPMAVFMRITVSGEVEALHDAHPVKMVPCGERPHDSFDRTPYHSDLVLPPSTFEVTGMCAMNTDDDADCKRHLPSDVYRQLYTHRRALVKEENGVIPGIHGMRLVVIDLKHTAAIAEWGEINPVAYGEGEESEESEEDEDSMDI